MDKVYYTVGKIFVGAVVGKIAGDVTQKVIDTGSTMVAKHKQKKATKIVSETMNELDNIENSLSLQVEGA